MGRNKTCAVPKCKSGYGSNKSVEAASYHKISKHGFPLHNESLSAKWLDAISRDSKSVNLMSAVICSLHFTDDCFETERKDNDQKLIRRRLKPNAIPTLFKEDAIAKMKSKPLSPPKSNIQSPILLQRLDTKIATDDFEDDDDGNDLEDESDDTDVELDENVWNMDKVDNLSDINRNTDRSAIVKGVIFVPGENLAQFIYPSINNEGRPILGFSLTISPKLECRFFVGNDELEFSSISHLIDRNKITRLCEIYNIINFLKSIADCPEEKSDLADETRQCVTEIRPCLSHLHSKERDQIDQLTGQLSDSRNSPISRQSTSSFGENPSPNLDRRMLLDPLFIGASEGCVRTVNKVFNLGSRLSKSKKNFQPRRRKCST